jgi:ketosteroid isomerase-like protein
MTDRQTIQALIEQGYAARRTGDIEGVLAIFHPDAKFELAGSKFLTPAVGISQGHPELRTALAGLIASFEFIQRDIISSVVDGERAAIHSRVKLRCIPRDKTVTTDILDLWKFEDGKVVEFVEFVDTALINDLMS